MPAYTRRNVPQLVELTTAGGGVSLTGIDNVDYLHLTTDDLASAAIVWVGSGTSGTLGDDDEPYPAAVLPQTIDVRGRPGPPRLYVTGADLDVRAALL
jgi:hypothetical protein